MKLVSKRPKHSTMPAIFLVGLITADRYVIQVLLVGQLAKQHKFQSLQWMKHMFSFPFETSKIEHRIPLPPPR